MKYIIGIDPGKNTGLAIWDVDAQKFASLKTIYLHELILIIRELWQAGEIDHVVYEDAHASKPNWQWMHRTAKEERSRMQGVGSVKRDSTILADMLADWAIPHKALPPQSNKTKLTSEKFERITGYDRRTSNHARDAAMLVYKRKPIGRKASEDDNEKTSPISAGNCRRNRPRQRVISDRKTPEGI